MDGLFKLIVGFAAWVCVLAGLEDVPEWAQFISLSLLLAGFIAHKGD